jgi:hypothetical protein
VAHVVHETQLRSDGKIEKQGQAYGLSVVQAQSRQQRSESFVLLAFYGF